MDVFSKSDPLCVLFTTPFGKNEWKEVTNPSNIIVYNITHAISLLYNVTSYQY